MFNDDFDEFFDTDQGFAVSASITIGGADPVEVDGQFRDEYAEVYRIELQKPEFVCSESAVSGVSHGDGATVNGNTYKVVGVEPFDAGMVRLRLELTGG